jgi:hypothetical protein
MSLGTITKDGIIVEWCCERMDYHINRGTQFNLAHLNGKTALYMKVVIGFGGIEAVAYCPFCGTRVNITYDPHDELAVTARLKGKAIRPGEWSDPFDKL